jgi:hypothetical protein
MISNALYAQSDTLNATDGSGEDWGLLMFGLIGILFVFVSIGIGIAITFIFLGLLSALISLGILSTAIWYGWYKNSLEKGFNFFLIGSVMALTIFLGTVGLMGLNFYFKWMSNLQSFIYGFCTSLVVGVILGWIVLYLFKKIMQSMIKKYKLDIYNVK